MEFDNSTHIAINEHEIIRVVAGEAESLRSRLATALQQLGWRVTTTMPLKAKHGARGAATYMLSANALEYPATLEISLQPHSAHATQVTFEYRIKHGGLGKGDYRSLTREAEALIALAQAQATQTHCRNCAAPLTVKTRFCRQCGAPTASALPAEVEVMQLTANTRAGYQWTAIGAGVLAISNFLILFALWARSNQRGFFALGVASVIVSLFGWWSLLAGMRRTHLTLNPPGQDEEEFEPRVAVVPYLDQAEVFPALPAAPAANDMNAVGANSITEHTTALLREQRSAVAPEPVIEAPARITNEFDK